MYNRLELNTARNCLRYIVRAFNIREIYIPFYTCPVVWQNLQKENCKIHFYHIDAKFMPVNDLPKEAFILYTNYFGISAKNVKVLCEKYRNIIIDNAQAFFMPPCGIASFSSARKFLQVNDGAILHTKKIIDIELKFDSTYKTKGLKEYGFNIFEENEKRLNDKEIMYMPKSTKSVIDKTNIKEIKEIRLSNFQILNNALKNTNRLEINLDIDDCPMFYPYLNFNIEVEKKLTEQGIYIEHLWNKLPDNTVESIFQKHLLLLPINQNQKKEFFEKIINIIFMFKV